MDLRRRLIKYRKPMKHRVKMINALLCLK